jgi:hypothetical protein
MTRWMWAAGLVVGGTALYVLAATRSSDATTPAARPAVPVAARPAPVLRGATPAPRALPVEPAPRADAAEERAAAEPPTAEDIRDHIERGFAGDASVAAPDLAHDVERGVQSALPATSSVRSLVCRSSVCRVETVHRSLAEYRAFTERAFFGYEAVIRMGPVFSLPVDDPAPGQPVVTVAFVGRAGSTLPVR